MKEIHYELTVFKAFLFVVLISGCIYQVLDISYLYLNFKTNINVKLEKESIVEIPSLSICVNVSHTIRTDYLSEKFPEDINGNTSKWTQSKYLHRLSLQEQLINATINSEQLFNSCLVMKPIYFEDRIAEDYIDCRNLSKIRQYLTKDEKCFTVFSQLNGESDDRFRVDHDISVRDNAFVLFQINLKNQYLKDIYINLHSGWLALNSFQSSYIQIYNNKYSGYSFTYTKTTTELLSSPYETNCFNYSLKGYKSHSDCIDKCKAEYFQNRFNKWHPFIPVSDDIWNELEFGSKAIVANKTFDKLMSNTCALKCGKNDNCFNEYFDLKIVEKWKNAENVSKENNLFEILVYLPTGVTVKYTHCPRLGLSEYLAFLASILNLWFGISIITCSKFICSLYYYIQRSKGNTRRNSSSSSSQCYCFL